MEVFMNNLKDIGDLTPYAFLLLCLIIIIWKWGGKILDKIPTNDKKYKQNIVKKNKEDEVYNALRKALDDLTRQTLQSNEQMNNLITLVAQNIQKSNDDNQKIKEEIIGLSKENRDNIAQQTNVIISLLQAHLGGGKRD